MHNACGSNGVNDRLEYTLQKLTKGKNAGITGRWRSLIKNIPKSFGSNHFSSPVSGEIFELKQTQNLPENE